MNNQESVTNQYQKYTEVLKKAGFSTKEALVYELILSKGQIGISDLLSEVPYKRGDLYNILYSLRDKGAIEQTIKGSKINFRPKDPYRLIEFIEKEKDKYNQAQTAIETLLPRLFSDYNLLAGKPTIHYFEGIEGILKTYNLINNSGEKEFLLFRSIFDNNDPEEKKLIDKQKIKQKKIGIKMRFLSPLTEKTKDHYYHTDADKLVERRIVQKTRFQLPAQILIWGNSAAIISMRKDKIVTLIENKDIVDTFKIIFEYIWDSAEDYHENVVERWEKEKQ